VIALSVNVNKVATLRNSRGGAIPSVLEAARVIIDAGAPGITVHPRADQRHITTSDVHALADVLAPLKGRVEFNIEGDPRPDLLDVVRATRPDQCTLVPVREGEITSQAGWDPDTPPSEMRRVTDELKGLGIRVSVFVDPDVTAVDWAADIGADRVELYTEPFARAHVHGGQPAASCFHKYVIAARHAHERGLGINAGHDLDLDNLLTFRSLPHLAEVSIGHALVSRALFVGLAQVVGEYLAVLRGDS
jgi:pyridoxine 5-phosphate synthase